jgi:hypothetical protein
MSFSPQQVALFDSGPVKASLFLEIQGEVDLILSSHPAAMPRPEPGTDYFGKAVPCVVNWGDVSIGFELWNTDDELSSMVIEAVNVELPIHEAGTAWPVQFIRGKLSDYLNLLTISGGQPTTSSRPPFVAGVFFASPQGTLADNDRHYIFKGLVRDFEVTATGRRVTIYMTEDLRWNRRIEYKMSKLSTPLVPAENLGLPHPISYGQFSTWAHKDFHTGTVGPWSLNRPYFPACMNLATAYSYAESPDVVTVSPRSGLYSLGITNVPGYNFDGDISWQAPFMIAEAGVPNIINNERTAVGSHFEQETIAGLNPDIRDIAMHDLKQLNRLRLREQWVAQEMILPTREWDGVNNDSESVNIDSVLFGSTEKQRSRARVIDGDRYTWFADDDSAALGNRYLIYELGVERNLGAPIKVQMFSIWEGLVGQVNLTMRLDWGTGASATYTYDQTFGTMTAPIQIVQTADLTASPFALLTDAAQTNSWEFRQAEAHGAPPFGKGMLLTLKWSKTAASAHFRLIQCGLLVEYNPARRFVEFRERVTDEQVEETDVSGRPWVDTVSKVTVEKIIQNTQFKNQRRMYYAGNTMLANAGDGFPGSPAWVGAPAGFQLIHNPAEVLRHLIYHFGGGKRDDVSPSWPPIHSMDFNTATGDPRDWLKAEDDPTGEVGSLDEAVREATGLASETFKLAISSGNEVRIRDLAVSIANSIPGLKFFRTPEKHPGDPQTHRGMIGCVYPAVGSDLTYRQNALRLINVQTDTDNFAWAFTPRDEIVNDLRINYGFSTALGTYVRSLWMTGTAAYDTGWPLNTDGNEVTDPMSGEILGKLVVSYQRYGVKPLVVDLPLVYRWHEALAVRNNIVRWRSTQRIRLFFDARAGISDLLPGDVFFLDGETDRYFSDRPFGPLPTWPGIRWPLEQLPHGGVSWANKKFLVERVTHTPGDTGEKKMRVQAICSENLGGF